MILSCAVKEEWYSKWVDPVLEGKRVPCAYSDVLLNVGDIKNWDARFSRVGCVGASTCRGI